jgi:erythromycin esterase
MEQAFRFLSTQVITVLFTSCLTAFSFTISAQYENNIFKIDSVNSNLTFLNSILETKEILFLGESSHTVKEFNLVRVKLIHFLNEELDFNTIAFESSMSNCYVINQLRDSLSPLEMIKTSLFSVYQTEEILTLFKNLKINKKLNLIGFDNQENRLDTLIVTPWVGRQLKQQNQSLSIAYLSMIPSFKKHTSVYPIGQKDSYYQRGDSLIRLINGMESDLIKFNGKHYQFLKAHFQNLKSTLIQYGKKTEEAGIAYRDSCMAKNIIFIKNILYPESKLICWGHNVHISKTNPISSYPESAGRLVQAEFQNLTYHIGIYGGKDLNFTLKKPKKGSLNQLLNTQIFDNFFIETKNQNWANQLLKTSYMGYYNERIIPSKNFDAIIFFKIISPAIRLE